MSILLPDKLSEIATLVAALPHVGIDEGDTQIAFYHGCFRILCVCALVDCSSSEASSRSSLLEVAS